MSSNPPSREGQQELDEETARRDLAEGMIAFAARWFQIAAIVWLGVLSPRFLALRPIDEALYWFSWLVMAAGGFATLAIAVRRPNLRGGLIRTIVLLWLLLAIFLAF